MSTPRSLQAGATEDALGTPVPADTTGDRRLDVLLDATQTGEWEWEFATGTITWSPGLAQLHGMPRGWSPATYDAFRALIHPEDWPRLHDAAAAARAEGRGYELDFRVTLPDGSQRWLWTRAEVVPDGSRLVGITRDVTERRRRDDAERFISEVSRVLLATSSADDALQRLCELTVRDVSDWCAVQEVHDGAPSQILAVAHRDEAAVAMLRDVLSGGAARGVDDPRRIVVARRESIRLPRLETGSAAIVPVMAEGGAVIALLFLGTVATGRTLDDHDVALAEAIALRTAFALERLRLLEGERRAAGRTAALQRVTARLSAAATAEDVLHVAIEDGVAVIGASGGSIAYPEPGTSTMRRVTAGYAPEDASGLWEIVPFEADLPGPAAARTGETVWLSDRLEAEQLFPLLRDVFAHTPWTSLCALPITTGSRRGFFVAFFDERHEFGPDDRAFTEAIVTLCSQALERARLLDAERVTSDRLARLQRVTALLGAAMTVGEVARIIVHEGITALQAAAGALVLVRPDGLLETVEALGYGDEVLDLYRRFGQDEPVVAAQVFTSGVPRWVESLAEMERTYPPEELALDPHLQSEAYVPLHVGDTTLGVLLVSFEGPRTLSTEERVLLLTLGHQCAQAVANAKVFEREHRIAEELQRALLPHSVEVPDTIGVSVRYIPGSGEADIGGDWYDLVVREDGRLGGSVGDVAGKGVLAASRMGQLRTAQRAYSIDGLPPAGVVARLNRLVEATDSFLATMVALDLDPETGELRHTIAGHPPPVLLRADGSCAFLTGGESLPLGVGPDTQFAEGRERLQPGDLVLLYTDGLVERRGTGFDEAKRALLDAVAAQAGRGPEDVVDGILAALVADERLQDDAVLLVLRYDEPPRPPA